jgi:hypothetical protein
MQQLGRGATALLVFVDVLLQVEVWQMQRRRCIFLQVWQMQRRRLVIVVHRSRRGRRRLLRGRRRDVLDGGAVR